MNRLILLSVCSVLFAQDMQLKQVIISPSAIQSDRIKGTLGQPVFGRTISDNYIINSLMIQIIYILQLKVLSKFKGQILLLQILFKLITIWLQFNYSVTDQTGIE